MAAITINSRAYDFKLPNFRAIGEGISKFFQPKPVEERRPEPKAFYYGSTGESQYQIFGISFNGEKNLGEMGPIKAYQLDYQALRLRSWQAYLESDVAQLIINKYTMSVIGGGLKLQANPHMDVLKNEGVKFKAEDFNDMIEAYFESFCKSKNADWQGEKTLREMMFTAFVNKDVGGDVLVVLRVADNNEVKVQIIDGDHVWNPVMGNDMFAYRVPPGSPGAGNYIRNGVEYDEKGETTAYYVRTANPSAGMSFYTGTFERIPAKSPSTGLTMAYLVSGLEYRIDNKRAMPLLSAVLETIKTMERYKQATVGTAEELAKVAYQITHQAFSSGENPMLDSLAKISNIDATVTDDVPVDIRGHQLAKTVAATTKKEAFNMPKGAEIKPLNQTSGTLYFKDFYNTNIDLVCSVVGIPPEVAKSMYNSNYSASRAAIKDWLHTILVKRQHFGYQFLQPIYELFLHVKILENKIDAPGYLKAFAKNNTTVLAAYRHCHWIGAPVANIDPLKEILAKRLQLGDTSDSMPLTTVEKTLEDLGENSDVTAIFKQYKKELKKSKKLGIVTPMKPGKKADEPMEEEKEDPKAIMRSVFKEVMAEMMAEQKD